MARSRAASTEPSRASCSTSRSSASRTARANRPTRYTAARPHLLPHGPFSGLPIPLGHRRSLLSSDPTARTYPETCLERPKTASEPCTQAAAYRCVTWLASRRETSGCPFSRSDRPLPGRHGFPRTRGEKLGFRDLRKGRGAGAGIPPFDSGFPAFGAQSSKVQNNGRKRRSCSPSLTYVISCRDLCHQQSASTSRRRAGRRPSVPSGTPSTTSTAGLARTTRHGPGWSSPATAPMSRRRVCGPGSGSKPHPAT